MKFYLIVTYILVMTFICSCVGQKATNSDELTGADTCTKTFSFKDSCQHLVVSFSLELPMGADSASVQVRDSLIADFMFNALQPSIITGNEKEFGITPYQGDMTDAQAIVDYYGKAEYDFLLKQALSDFNSRIQYLDDDTTMTAEEKDQIKKEIPQWNFELSIAKTIDTQNFVVYNSQTYIYYGGAHGGVSGSGALTFNKKTGNKINAFLKADATAALQPLIRKGLLHYYSECGETMIDAELSDRLQIFDVIIPQPANTPHPNATGDSLIFTYRQYEIACYADGMPSFKIATKDLLPHLTAEGKAILNAE